ncbi:hypothetical protein IWX49DRAFT_118684 [Phyllosticta citricarpa]|uniref:BolA-like protein n=1 Tax=Phyllosticta citricarpa TaxID=55181 RepID=A0ABR1MD61_9PEZI
MHACTLSSFRRLFMRCCSPQSRQSFIPGGDAKPRATRNRLTAPLPPTFARRSGGGGVVQLRYLASQSPCQPASQPASQSADCLSSTATNTMRRAVKIKVSSKMDGARRDRLRWAGLDWTGLQKKERKKKRMRREDGTKPDQTCGPSLVQCGVVHTGFHMQRHHVVKYSSMQMAEWMEKGAIHAVSLGSLPMQVHSPTRRVARAREIKQC